MFRGGVPIAELSTTDRALVSLVAAMTVALVLGIFEGYRTRSAVGAAIITFISCTINTVLGFGLMIASTAWRATSERWD